MNAIQAELNQTFKSFDDILKTYQFSIRDLFDEIETFITTGELNTLLQTVQQKIDQKV